MSIWLQKSASIQPRTSLPKFQEGVSFTLQFHIRAPAARSARPLRPRSPAAQPLLPEVLEPIGALNLEENYDITDKENSDDDEDLVRIATLPIFL